MVAIQKNPVVLDGMLGQVITPPPGMEAPGTFVGPFGSNRHTQPDLSKGRVNGGKKNPKVQRGGFHHP